MIDDVIIVGGGISGLATATALAKLGLKVTVIDKAPLSLARPIAHPLRYVAINAASKTFLQSLSAWPKENEVSSYQKMFIWDEGSNGQVSFEATEFALPSLGYIVSEKALLEEIARLDSVCLVGDSLLDEICIDDLVSVHCQTGVKKAKLLIGADGANSWVKKTLNFTTKEKPYGHHAIVATVTMEKSHQQTAFQRFTQSGPLAFLPLSNEHQCSIVYSCDARTHQTLMGADDNTFLKKLSEDFEYQLGQITAVSERIAFPLVERHCREYVRPHVALIADAIHTIHPLAGLGLNLGLKDVASLVKAISKNTDNVGEYRLLRAYERERKGHNTFVLSLMSAIKNGYALSGLPAVLRGFGMNLIGNSSLAKRAIIKQAMML